MNEALVVVVVVVVEVKVVAGGDREVVFQGIVSHDKDDGLNTMRS